MKLSNKVSMIVISAVSALGLIAPIAAHAATTAPALGTFAGYSVYSDAGVTDVAASSHVWGKVGDNNVNHGGANALLTSQVDSGIIDAGAGIATDAFTTAFNFLDLGSQTPVVDMTPIGLNGDHTVTPGVYLVGATALTGTLTLDGAGVYIFRSDSSISVSGAGTMVLKNGATACNVFWEIPTSMTISNAGHIEGTIIAKIGDITFAHGASLIGRALAHTAITLDDNLITEPVCAATPPGTTSTGAGTGANYFNLLPLISILKVPSPLALPNGAGSVTYTYTVKNLGKAAMNTVWVKDDKCSPVTFTAGDTNSNGLLDLTETWTYSCTKTVSKTETNTATAHGYANGFDVYDNSIATVVVSLPIIPPLIHLVKVPNIFGLPAGGGAVTYSYAVTNPGTAPLSNVSITDDKCTGLPGRVVGHPGDLNKNNLLDPGETWQFTCKTNLTQTTTNIGTATGYANGLMAIDYSPATVYVAPPGLPNTGLPPQMATLWDAVIALGVLALISSSFVVLKKRAS